MRVNRSYLFGDWLVEPHLNRVSRNEEEHQLEPRAMDVLRILLERQGEVVSADELLDGVWNGRYHEPSMVAKRISKIRHLLKDSAKNPLFIETISKRGYRTIAPVDTVTDIEIAEKATPKPRIDTAPSSLPDASLLRSCNSVKSLFSRVRLLPFQLPFIVIVVAIVSGIYSASKLLPNKAQARSIAVLPLENLSGDTSQDYIADGMTEELISELAKLNYLRVTSRTSVMQYENTQSSLKSIAKELDVELIIEGSVVRENNRFRVIVQLIDAKSDTHLWAENFDRSSESVLEIRSDIAQQVAATLGIELSEDEAQSIENHYSVDSEAYDAYLRGIAQIDQLERLQDWLPKVRAELTSAVSLDTGFADAWAMLALVESISAVWVDPDYFDTVRKYSAKALAINNRLGRALTAMGYVHLFADWNFVAAEQVFKKALDYAPSDRLAMQGYLIYLSVMDKRESADSLSQLMVAGSPYDILTRNMRIDFLYGARQHTLLLQETTQNRTIYPKYQSMHEAASYLQLGRFHDSYIARINAYKLCGSPCDNIRKDVEAAWTHNGHEGVLRALLEHDGFFHVGSQRIAILSQLGEFDTALAELESLATTKTPWLAGLRYHPDFDLLRLNPRLDTIADELGIPAIAANPHREADRARLLAFSGRADDAIEELTRIIATHPNHTELGRWQQFLSWAYFSASAYKDAVHWAEKALAQNTSPHDTAFTHLILSSAYAKLNLDKAARQSLKEALTAWPEELVVKRDLKPLFLGSDNSLESRFLDGLEQAGLSLHN